MRYLVVLFTVAAAGCSVTGTDSKSEFACQAPEGVQCMTTSGVYYNSLSNNLPALKTGGKTVSQEASAPAAPSRETAARARPAEAGGVGTRAPDFYAAGAVRAVPRVMRVWILPWEDADGDLHDQSYLYMALDSGRWMIEHTRNAIQPHKLGGTTLLFGDTSAVAGEAADPDAAKSGFSRDLEKLAPASASQ